MRCCQSFGARHSLHTCVVNCQLDLSIENSDLGVTYSDYILALN
jgi:hypothetical protein